MTDNVNNPKHYAQDEIECIDVILQQAKHLPGDEAALYANVQKYIWRYHSKDNAVEDLSKAQWYLNKLIEVVKNKSTPVNDVQKNIFWGSRDEPIIMQGTAFGYYKHITTKEIKLLRHTNVDIKEWELV